ncbi:ferrous iron transport protein B [Sedimentibacter acidaminivorans]|jgi:ferrous iron transport protein B|uniref:Ferrous iron transport protein B n=1 Tax=Sedimentibacter acidaminivorans TaxID=913099 RepID=A0ABS4GC00_9FIRM|nr:ferrous iron transport protein B [Sedimentibacter acidaminivorans]MBP1924930.1 ferrous iron transport protein B [Sedimentibacter acidaminivorans]
MITKIALAGNPNSGKTTLFNELTGSSQYVGNWPGVTVEKKEGKLKGYKDITIVDLPGIYSLSPYTLEEVITRDYLIKERPDVIINIVDGTNLERNLYLSSQLTELKIPMIIALNMMDIVKKIGTEINVEKLSNELNCPIAEISAINGLGVKALMNKAIEVAKKNSYNLIQNKFSKPVQDAISEIENIYDNYDCTQNSEWLAIKIFERDAKVVKDINLPEGIKTEIDTIIDKLEKKYDDDSESIITNERYEYIGKIIKECVVKKINSNTTVSNKVDSILTNKWTALPIFFAIMWVVYYISITTIGDMTIGYVELIVSFIQNSAESILNYLDASVWTIDLVVNGIIGSIGAIFTFVPQLMILFFFLSLLEDSGYMSRVAFIMDRIFRKFGLSGKSFIPMLIGTGCSIPGLMASRTIENEKDRKMTIMLTPFIPCGAKLPVFAMFIALMFPDASWVGPSMYLIGISAVIFSGIILKRTRLFAGEPAPFIMELPNYKLPRLKGVSIHMWEKGKSFIKKAGTIIFVACTALWFLQSFSFSLEYLGAERIEESMLASLGEAIRWIFIPLGFGETWAASVASVTGLIAKEVVVATFASVGSVIPIEFTQVTAFAFMIFTLFAAPCFAAIGAIKTEMRSWKWTLIAIGYQTGVAYIVAFLINVIGSYMLKGTNATQKKVLDISIMEEVSENAVVNGDIVLIVFGVFIAISIITVVANKFKTIKKYAKA